MMMRTMKSMKAGLAPLHIAAQSGYIQVLKALIQCGAKLDIYDKNMYSPLHLAAKSNNCEVIELLVKAGADINAVKAKNKWTPLHVAVREDNALVVEKLINLKADINALTIGNKTPIQEAVHHKKEMVVSYFVKKDFKMDATQFDEHSQKWLEELKERCLKYESDESGINDDESDSAISSDHESRTSDLDQ